MEKFDLWKKAVKSAERLKIERDILDNTVKGSLDK